MKNIFVYGLMLTLILTFISHASALCVKVPKANLRKGPGTTYKKTWQVFKYMPFKKLEGKGNWYKVEDLDGDVHWIYSNLVTNKIDCAVVKVDEANVRSGAGIKFRKKDFSPAIKYDSFKVINRKGSWVNVIDEFGNKGWIFRKLLWIY